MRIAQPELIARQKYDLAIKYVQPDRDFDALLRMWRQKKTLIESGRFKEAQFKDFAEQQFSNGTATLVALLIKAERRPEAESIANRAKKEWDSPELAAKLQSALEGKVPPPCP